MGFYTGVDLLQKYLQAYTPSLNKTAAWPQFSMVLSTRHNSDTEHINFGSTQLSWLSLLGMGSAAFEPETTKKATH